MCETCKKVHSKIAGRMAMVMLRIQKRWEQGGDHTRRFKELASQDVTLPVAGEPVSRECVDFMRDLIVTMTMLDASLSDAAGEWCDNIIPELQSIALLLDDLSREGCPECPNATSD